MYHFEIDEIEILGYLLKLSYLPLTLQTCSIDNQAFTGNKPYGIACPQAVISVNSQCSTLFQSTYNFGLYKFWATL